VLRPGRLGLVTVGGTAYHRDLIIALAARHRLPAVYPYWVSGGGLMPYGPDTIDQYRRAADYIDRIFKGEKPADLPVQAPPRRRHTVRPERSRV
jgi:putative ABC transport system substrate-binding protein